MNHVKLTLKLKFEIFMKRMCTRIVKTRISKIMIAPGGPLTLPLHVYNDNLGLRNETHIEQSGSVTHKVIYTKSMMMDTSTVNENNDTNLHTEDENNNLTRNVQKLE